MPTIDPISFDDNTPLESGANSDSDTDDEDLSYSDNLSSHPATLDADSLPSAIEVQPTDAVKMILAQARVSSGMTETQLEDLELTKPLKEDQSILTSSSYETDDTPDYKAVCSDWQQHNLHVFVLSEAGKPVYSRYGDEGRLASIMGVMKALVSFVATSGDELQAIHTDERTFMFLTRPHLILVAVGRSSESRAHMLVCLSYVYSQILSLLTLQRLDLHFTKYANLDLRRLLVGDNRLISSIVDFASESFGAFLQSVGYVSLSSQTRETIANIISQSVKSRSRTVKSEDVVFGLLLHRNHVVCLVCMKGQTLHASDVHLIINLVGNTRALKSAQTHWLPICLPKFDANGYLYAHIASLDEHTSLVLLSVDSTQFYALEEAKDTIFKRLQSTSDGEPLVELSSVQFPSVREIGVPELRHLVCKCIAVNQHVASEWNVPYDSPSFIVPDTSVSLSCSPEDHLASTTRSLRNHVLMTYRRMHSRLHNPSTHPTRLIYQSTPTEVFFAWVSSLYSSFNPSSDMVVSCLLF
ncbi:hypothetical protein P879_10164 [Paragonimus westermani]|uniref:Vacuolar fusion protein MON1 homolog n=1 Tax=Paragonimus westermani TaxID=34504 RepID=A0A8T0DB06_9TREM|nr:hypothetical protein P879_10164 [Paragonimus westermani]